MNSRLVSFFFLVVSVSLFSCNNGDSSVKREDTPTSGSVNVFIDESYKLLFDTQIFTFESLYKRAEINAFYKPESESLKALINDSCKVIVINRDLTEQEKKQFASKNIFPKSTKIAEDAIALIVHPDNPDTLLSLTQLKAILSGKDTLWKQVNSKASDSKIHVVFDNPQSANARYLSELIGDKPLQKNCFAVNSNPDVIEYVTQNKNALGVISVNWISDREDTLSQSFLKKVKVVALAKEDLNQFYKPYQAYIKTKDYPLSRDVYMITRQTRSGLGMGFVSFVAGEKGQRIILKSGLIPSTMPVRIIQLK